MVCSGSLGFIWLCTWGSLHSLGYALGVVGIVRGRTVQWVRPGASQVRSGSLGSLGCALGVGRWVHLGELWGTFRSFAVAWFIGVRHCSRRVRLGFIGLRTGCRRVRSRSLGSLGYASGIHLEAQRPWARQVRFWSLG